MPRESKRAFVSYAHEDRDLARRLVEGLGYEFPILDLHVWWDAAIRPGEAWCERIRSNLEQADLVVLLVSGAFASSSFINCEELPRTLERISLRKADLLWIAVDAEGNAWADTQWLGERQAARRRQTIGDLDGAEFRIALSDIRNEVLRLLDVDGHQVQQSLNAKYLLRERLAAGRSFQIYQAHDQSLARDVAVYCPADDQQRKRLEDTVLTATRQASPSTAMVYGAWLDAYPIPHVIVQYANRGSLARRITETWAQTRSGLPPEDVRALILHLAGALALDARSSREPLELRPGKVLIDDSAGFLISPFVRWRREYGLLLQAHLRDPATSPEERAYVTPELISGPPRNLDRIYQYLLGLVAYHAITGELPHAHDGVDEFPATERPRFEPHLPSPNARGPRCSPWLADLIVTMTARDPEDRLASLDDIPRRLAVAPAEELGLVRVSYERCLESGADDFFSSVYARLRDGLPADQWKFKEGIDWHAQHATLAEAIALLLAFYALGSSRTEPTPLSRIARNHGRDGHGISPQSFPCFQDALIDTVMDTLKPGPDDRDPLEAAWKKVLRSGIDYLRERTR